MRRPATVTALGVLLILIAALLLFFAVRGMLSYFESAQYGGVVTRMSLADYLLERPLETLLPPLIGVLAGVAAAGVFGGWRWARPIAIVVGAATILGGAILLLGVVAEWGVPGSFAILLAPPGLLAVLVGGFVVWAALRNAAYLPR